jgi:hypothetical protein
MKGLANSAPDTLTMVKVQNRKARKHYGTEWRTKYDERVHGHISDKKSWSGMEGYYKVNAMEWFIRKVCYSPVPPSAMRANANAKRAMPSPRTSLTSRPLSGQALWHTAVSVRCA